MRIITCCLFLLLNSYAYGVVVDSNNSAISEITLSNIDPAVTPVTRISGKLNFEPGKALNPGDSVLVTAFNASGSEIGASQYTNTYPGSITSCACIDIYTATPLEDVTFKIGIQSVGGAIYDVTDTVVVQALTAEGPDVQKEIKFGYLTIGAVPPLDCVTDPTTDGCPCPPGYTGGFYPSCVPPVTGPSDFGLVYNRAPRTMTPINCCDDASLYDTFNDVSKIYSGWVKASLIYDDLNGNVEVIEDCADNPARDCAAVEARVSPDATKIIYSLSVGQVRLPPDNPKFNYTTNAQLWVYDIATKTKTPIPQPTNIGYVWDRTPEWISNDKIVFASTRANEYPTTAQMPLHRGFKQTGGVRQVSDTTRGNVYSGINPVPWYPSMQIWTMNIDGSDAKNITPHETMALRPFVDTEGDILFSSWQVAGQKTATSKTSPNPTTNTNLFWINRVDQNGGDQTTLLGAHRASYPGALSASGKYSGGDVLALRSITNDSQGRHYVTNYYRGNHSGAGWIFRWKNVVPHVEGCSTVDCLGASEAGAGGFNPTSNDSNFLQVTPYGQGQDTSTQRHAVNGKIMGKAGYPTFAANDQLIFSHGRGWCYSGSPPYPGTVEFLGGEPLCDFGIWTALTEQITDPFDTSQMVPLIDDPDYHEWDADVVDTYQNIYGVAMPAQQPPYADQQECYLNVVDATKNEVFPRNAYNFATNLSDCAKQGCVQGHDVSSLSDDIAALRIYQIDMWNSYEERKEYLGYNYHNMTLLGDQPLESDGSVRAQLPCDVPFLMMGVDSEGLVIARDEMPHSLRVGEERACHGCHDAHGEERYKELGSIPPTDRFPGTIAASTDPAILNLNETLTFTDDILPILEANCESCHTEFTRLKNTVAPLANATTGMLYDAIASDYEGFDLMYQTVTGGNGDFPRPIANVNVHDEGTGYAVGEALDFSSAIEGAGAAGVISEIGPNGEIYKIALSSGGSNYSDDVAVTVATVGGSGADLVGLRNQQFLSHPYKSHWGNRFAKDSILYWKCLNERKDGRTDSTYDNDMDFGPDHPTTATPEECATIARWIDGGAQERW